MSVRVNIHPSLRHATGGKDVVEVQGRTVGECLDSLVQIYPAVKDGLFDKKSKLLNYVDIYVNLESSHPEGLAKPVKVDDEIYLVLMIAGG